MYAPGMTVREIQRHLEELYGIDVSPDLISAVTDTVLEAVAEWQNRPLELCYPLVFFDAIRVKIGDEGFVRKPSMSPWPCSLTAAGDPRALDRADGRGKVLAAGHEPAEEPWLPRYPNRRGRRIEGLPQVITAVFLQTIVQTCIVHLIRHSLEFASYKDRRTVVPELRAIYRARDAEAGHQLHDERKRGQSFEASASCAFPWDPGDEAAMKLLYLVLTTRLSRETRT